MYGWGLIVFGLGIFVGLYLESAFLGECLGACGIVAGFFLLKKK